MSSYLSELSDFKMYYTFRIVSERGTISIAMIRKG